MDNGEKYLISIVALVVAILFGCAFHAGGQFGIPKPSTHIDEFYAGDGEFTYTLSQDVTWADDRILVKGVSLDEIKVAKAHWDSVLVVVDIVMKEF